MKQQCWGWWQWMEVFWLGIDETDAQIWRASGTDLQKSSFSMVGSSLSPPLMTLTDNGLAWR